MEQWVPIIEAIRELNTRGVTLEEIADQLSVRALG
jgi:orotate phosphoribosyltransferase-like protein